MADDFKVNLKVPEAARDLLVEIAARLREDSNFLGRLKGFYEEDSRESVVSLLKELNTRMSRFEARVDELSEDIHSVSDGQFIGPDPEWVTGEGTGKRLTKKGEVELQRLIDRGLTDKEIAIRLGIAIPSVARKRKALAFETLCRSGPA
jgi:hypothetical protein